MVLLLIKNNIFAIKSEDKLHLGIKNKKICFILLSVCIIFAVGNEKNKIKT